MPHQGKIGRSIEMNNEFMVMDEEELLDVDGGAVWLVVGGVLESRQSANVFEIACNMSN
jgi:hypothetical protein